MLHKFHLRQRVHLIARPGRLAAADSYEVVRHMPADPDGIPTYRIKSTRDERAVRESDIELSA